MRVLSRYRDAFTNRNFLIKLPLAVAMFAASSIVQFYAGTYATDRASNAVTDIILSNIPVFDVDLLFIYGAVVLIVFLSVLCLLSPKQIPFVLNGLTLIIVVRSIFITLTHIGPFPDQIKLDVGAVTSKFIFGGDLFFSNHTAIPFMMALVFWHNRALRYLFITWSIFFGTIALMGHLHYTIDVLSAFFITYSVYRAAIWLFPSEYKMFEETKNTW